MKKALKVTFGTLLAAGVVTTGSAYDRDFFHHLAVHVNGTYSQATDNGTSYGDVLLANPAATTDGGRRTLFIRPQHDVDWGAGFTYHVPRTHTRLFFHYDHFDDGQNSAGAANVRNLGFAPGQAVNHEVTSATANVRDHSQEFTLGLDRRIHFGPRYNVHTAAFFEWDRLKRTMFEQNAAFNFVPVGAVNRLPLQVATRETENKLHGFGPGIGFKFVGQPLCNYNFGLFASFASSLLYVHNKYRVFALEQFREGDVTYFYNPEKTSSIISKLDISFGAEYKRLLHIDAGKLEAGISLGMRYVNFINAFKNGNVYYNPQFNTPPVNNVSGIAANLGHSEDWGRLGPFLQFRVGGAHS